MPRKTSDGKYVLSAGEIGMYTVCPESWRLKLIERVKANQTESVAVGRKLHQEWANKFDNAATLARSARLITLLVGLAILTYALLKR